MASVCGVKECVHNGRAAQETSRSAPAARACGGASPPRRSVDSRHMTPASTRGASVIVRGAVIARDGCAHLVGPPSRRAAADSVLSRQAPDPMPVRRLRRLVIQPALLGKIPAPVGLVFSEIAGRLVIRLAIDKVLQRTEVSTGNRFSRYHCRVNRCDSTDCRRHGQSVYRNMVAQWLLSGDRKHIATIRRAAGQRQRFS
jgi:hypothetical protein